jgi:ABC-type transport system substrate-binding protein
LLTLLVGCRSGSSSQGLHLYLPDNVNTLDPTLGDDLISTRIIHQIYETPMQYRYPSTKFDELEPLLLNTIPEISADGLQVTLKFRQGVMFQDDPCFTASQGKGRELHADDFRLAIHRVLDSASNSGGFWTYSNKLVGDEEFLKITRSTPFSNWKDRLELYRQHPIQGIKIVDAHTVQLQLRQPFPLLHYVLAMSYSAPIAAEALRFYETDISSHPVGTGPYHLKEWLRNAKVLLTRNQPYWGKRPAIAEISFEIIIEQQPQWLKFLNHQLDLVYIPKDNFDQVLTADNQLKPEMANKGYQLVPLVQPIIWFLGFNMQDPLLRNDPLLRQAIALAYDSAKRVQILTNNRGIRATSIFPPGITGHDETSKSPLVRDIVKAKELLQQSHFAVLKKPPTLTYDLRGQSSAYRQWGELFKREMDELGIKTKIVLNSFNEYIEKEKSGRIQLFLGGWIADLPDAENFLQLLYGPYKPPGPNATSYNVDKYNQLFKQLTNTIEPAKRLELIKQLNEIIDSNPPWVLDFYAVRYDLAQPWLKNYHPHPFCYNYLKYLVLENH